MKKAYIAFIITAALFAATCISAHSENANAPSASRTAGKPGLLVIAHGSPPEAPNKLVLGIKPSLLQALGKDSPFGAVEICFMEFAHPSVAEGVKALEGAGCSRIIAVPLLVGHSRHSLLEIPALLGLYSDPEISKVLLAEGAEFARPRVLVTITPPLSSGNVLLECLLESVSKLSTNPEDEALVVFAHGSPMAKREWNDLLRRSATYACGKMGITYSDWACIGMGSGFLQDGARAVSNAAQKRKRVLVAGIYLVTGMKALAMGFGGNSNAYGKTDELTELLHGDNIIYTDKGLLPNPKIASWIARTAKAAAAQQARTPKPEPIRIIDEDSLLCLSIDDAVKFHGDKCVCLVSGFRVIQLAIRELWGNEIPKRSDIRILSALPGKGCRDVFEFITRAESRGDMKVILPAGSSNKNVRLDNWVFTFTRKSTGQSVEIKAKGSVFPGSPEDYFALRTKTRFGKNVPGELKKKFESDRNNLRKFFLNSPLDSLFEFKKKDK